MRSALWQCAGCGRQVSVTALQPGQPITLDITSVGTTYAGERLVVTIRL